MAVRIGAVIYFISAFVQIFAPNIATLVVGRSIQGLAVGMLSMAVPILQCEIAPAHARGFFVSIEYLCLNAGYAVSAWVGYGFFFAIPNEISWRGPYIVQAVLASALFSWTLFLPETPRWLIKNGFHVEGLGALADLHGTGNTSDPAIQASYAEIAATVESEKALGEAPWSQVFKQYTRRTIIGMTCQLFAQFNGINAILYFLPQNLGRAGFTIPRALLYSAACSLVYCAGTIPTMFLIDRWGRRMFLLVGSCALAIALAIIGGLQYHANTLPLGDARIPTADGIFAAVCVYLFFFGAT
jgi:MFS family permease